MRNRINGGKSKRLEIKSSARRHGPSAFVKDADFAYIDIESRSNSRKKKHKERELERYRSLERYHSVKVDGEGSEIQTRDDMENIEGAVMVADSSSSSRGSSQRSSHGDDIPPSNISSGDNLQTADAEITAVPGTPIELNPTLDESQNPTEEVKSESQSVSGQGTKPTQPPPDILDQVALGQDQQSTKSVHGSTTVIYVVGDDYKSIQQSATTKQKVLEQDHSPKEMAGYIDEIEGEFEDPRMYISYL